MKKYFIQTFGCAMNQADSEKINMILLQSGFFRANKWEDADLVVFNTCSVRQKGEDRVFGMAREIEKENIKRGKGKSKGNYIYVGITGCMVRKTGLNSKYIEESKKRDRAKKINLLQSSSEIFNNDDKLFPRLKNLDFTLRIEETNYIPHILTEVFGEKIGSEHKFDDYLKQSQYRDNPSTASVIIQTGCDNHCSFCIVPQTRGEEISRPINDILDECKQAVDSGAKEITLLGQNVNSYGKQFLDKKLWNSEKSKWNDGIGKSPFRELLEGINNTGVDRIRFTSSNPHDMTDDILSAHFDLKSTCNYLHFALQSGSNKMLKIMNRKHSYEDFKSMVKYLRSKDPLFSISTDIIVGYCNESDEMFEETINAFRECIFDFAYIARYSVRPGTIASKIYPDNVDDKTKSERWHILNEELKKCVLKRNELMLNREEKILINNKKDGLMSGRTRNFKEVFIEDNPNMNIGDLVSIKITELDSWILKAKQI